MQAALAADSTYAKAAASLSRVSRTSRSRHGATVDLAALAAEFETLIEQWRMTVTDSVPVDTVARDSTAGC